MLVVSRSLRFAVVANTPNCHYYFRSERVAHACVGGGGSALSMRICIGEDVCVLSPRKSIPRHTRGKFLLRRTITVRVYITDPSSDYLSTKINCRIIISSGIGEDLNK